MTTSPLPLPRMALCGLPLVLIACASGGQVSGSGPQDGPRWSVLDRFKDRFKDSDSESDLNAGYSSEACLSIIKEQSAGGKAVTPLQQCAEGGGALMTRGVPEAVALFGIACDAVLPAAKLRRALEGNASIGAPDPGEPYKAMSFWFDEQPHRRETHPCLSFFDAAEHFSAVPWVRRLTVEKARQWCTKLEPTERRTLIHEEACVRAAELSARFAPDSDLPMRIHAAVCVSNQSTDDFPLPSYRSQSCDRARALGADDYFRSACAAGGSAQVCGDSGYYFLATRRPDEALAALGMACQGSEGALDCAACEHWYGLRRAQVSDSNQLTALANEYVAKMVRPAEGWGKGHAVCEDARNFNVRALFSASLMQGQPPNPTEANVVWRGVCYGIADVRSEASYPACMGIAGLLQDLFPGQVAQQVAYVREEYQRYRQDRAESAAARERAADHYAEQRGRQAHELQEEIERGRRETEASRAELWRSVSAAVAQAGANLSNVYGWQPAGSFSPATASSGCDQCASSCSTQTNACGGGSQASCYRAAACLCSCQAMNGGCGSSSSALAQCVRENQASAERLSGGAAVDPNPPAASQPASNPNQPPTNSQSQCQNANCNAVPAW